jgi:hypothetical protein
LGDLGVKGLKADLKAFCLGVAQTVVLGGGKCAEARKSLLVGFGAER